VPTDPPPELLLELEELLLPLLEDEGALYPLPLLPPPQPGNTITPTNNNIGRLL
jgi:hypothetical protein